MSKISNELKIGLTVLVAVVVAFIGFRIMKDMPLFKSSTTMYTKFSKVNGLLPGNLVNVNGYKIGSVKKMEITSTDSVLVTLNLEEGYNIPVGSKAVLKSSGLLGNKFIEINKSDRKEFIEDGGTIKGVYEQGMMDTFADKGAKLSDDITSSVNGIEELVNNLNQTLNDDNKDDISAILNELRSTTESLSSLVNRRQTDLDTMIVAAKNTLTSVEDLSSDNKEELSNMIRNLESTSMEMESLSKGLNQTNTTLSEVLDKINRGDGTLGKLLNDPSLYQNMDSLSVNLNSLIRNINDDPGRYLKHMRLVEIF